MKYTTMKQTGLVMMCMGAILLTIGTALMLVSFQQAQSPHSSATQFAENTSQSLYPSGFGMLFVIAGLLMLIVCWLRNRKPKRISFDRTDQL